MQCCDREYIVKKDCVTKPAGEYFKLVRGGQPAQPPPLSGQSFRPELSAFLRRSLTLH